MFGVQFSNCWANRIEHHSEHVELIPFEYRVVTGCVCLSSQRSVNSSSTTNNPSRSWRQQQSVEPLLRFPFANFLANPCGTMAASPTLNPTQPSWPGIVTERPISRHVDSNIEEIAQPAPLRPLATDGTSLDEQTLGFLGPLRDRYINRNYTSEERSALAQEFQLVVLEATHLARHIYPPPVSWIELSRLSLSILFSH